MALFSHLKLSQHENDSKPNIHPLYTEVKSKDGKVLYYNRKGGFLVKDFPVEIKLPSGGNDDLNQISNIIYIA